MSHSHTVARVILDTRVPQLDRLFDYRIPEGMLVQKGFRVKVPLKSDQRLAIGYVVEVLPESDVANLSDIAETVSPVEVLTPALWSLAQNVAGRGAGNVADVLRLAIPPRSVRVEKAWLQRTPAESAASQREDRELPSFPPGTLEAVMSPGSRTWIPYGDERDFLTIAQESLSRGESAIFVAPDWRDVRWLGDFLRQHLESHQLSVWDQDRRGSERYGDYLRCLEAEPVVVLGSRHSIYAPVSNLGVVVVLEDGDSQHQEPLAPYPHSRDVAVLRQAAEGCSVVFASRVPSLPVVRWIQTGFLSGHIPEKGVRPTVVPTALALGRESSFGPARLPSQAFQGAKEALAHGPVLVQVYRAGFAPGLVCASCGERVRCQRCTGPVAQRKQGHVASCTWCGAIDTGGPCPDCSASERRPLGFGLERTAKDLGKAFPGVTIIQADGNHPVYSVPAKPALVVATRGAEPRVEGGYRAALLLDGLGMLQRPSLGALEETLSAWEHAISLVYPEGRVFVTEVSGAPALAVSSGSYLPLLTEEWRDREMLRLPPAVRFVALEGPPNTVRAFSEALQEKFADMSPLGPVELSEGTIRQVLRFAYSQGADVQREARALFLKSLSSSRGSRASRVRVVLDDLRVFDSVVND